MKSQGEVDAEYRAAHSYIQQLQDEISQVLEAGAVTTRPACNSKPPGPTPPPKPSSTRTPASANTPQTSPITGPSGTPNPPSPTPPQKSTAIRTLSSADTRVSTPIDGPSGTRKQPAPTPPPKPVPIRTPAFVRTEVAYSTPGLPSTPKPPAPTPPPKPKPSVTPKQTRHPASAIPAGSSRTRKTHAPTPPPKPSGTTRPPVFVGTPNPHGKRYPTLDTARGHDKNSEACARTGQGVPEKKNCLEDVTNRKPTESQQGGQVSNKEPTLATQNNKKNFDAELYWTGRRISVADTRGRSRKEVCPDVAVSIIRRRRTSLEESNLEEARERRLGKVLSEGHGPEFYQRRKWSVGDFSRGRFWYDDVTRDGDVFAARRRTSSGESWERGRNRAPFNITGASGSTRQHISVEEIKPAVRHMNNNDAHVSSAKCARFPETTGESPSSVCPTNNDAGMSGATGKPRTVESKLRRGDTEAGDTAQGQDEQGKKTPVANTISVSNTPVSDNSMSVSRCLGDEGGHHETVVETLPSQPQEKQNGEHKASLQTCQDQSQQMGGLEPKEPFSQEVDTGTVKRRCNTTSSQKVSQKKSPQSARHAESAGAKVTGSSSTPPRVVSLCCVSSEDREDERAEKRHSSAIERCWQLRDEGQPLRGSQNVKDTLRDILNTVIPLGVSSNQVDPLRVSPEGQKSEIDLHEIKQCLTEPAKAQQEQQSRSQQQNAGTLSSPESQTEIVQHVVETDFVQNASSWNEVVDRKSQRNDGGLQKPPLPHVGGTVEHSTDTDVPGNSLPSGEKDKLPRSLEADGFSCTVHPDTGVCADSEGVTTRDPVDGGGEGQRAGGGKEKEMGVLEGSTRQSHTGHNQDFSTNTAHMTVCDQGFQLPLPSQDFAADDRLTFSSPSSSFPLFYPRRPAADDLPGPATSHDPESLEAALATLHTAVHHGTLGRDDLALVSSGRTLSQGEDESCPQDLQMTDSYPQDSQRMDSCPQDSQMTESSPQDSQMMSQVTSGIGQATGVLDARITPVPGTDENVDPPSVDKVDKPGRNHTKDCDSSLADDKNAATGFNSSAADSPMECKTTECLSKDSSGNVQNVELREEVKEEGNDGAPKLTTGLQSRDAQVQTSPSDSTTVVSMFPHVDSACQTSPHTELPHELLPSSSPNISEKDGFIVCDQNSMKNETCQDIKVKNERSMSDDRSVRRDIDSQKLFVASERDDVIIETSSVNTAPKVMSENVDIFDDYNNELTSDQGSVEKKHQQSRHQARDGMGSNEQILFTENTHIGNINHRQEDSHLDRPAISSAVTVRRRHTTKQDCKRDEEDVADTPKDRKPLNRSHSEKEAKRSGKAQQRSEQSRAQQGRSFHADKQESENFSFLPEEATEMQVMVNSLTPVLQRRKSARRSNSHTGTTTSSSGDDFAAGSEDLQEMLALIAANGEQRPKEGDAESPPLHRARPRDPSPNLSKLSCRPKTTRSAAMTKPEGDSSLFIKPKYARTWHGPMQFGTNRTAPRMGVSMVTADVSALTAGGHNARAAGGGHQGIMVGTHGHTLPISRTLLDALHKRYCSYQYSAGGWPLAAPLGPPPPPAQPKTSLTLSLPPQLAGAPVKKLNSEGESDTGSSVGTSTQSSPRTPHTQSSASTAVSPTSTAAAASTAVCVDGKPSSGGAKGTLRKAEGLAEKKHEIEAVEACQWLRAAGFPQYAQMFEDGLFPVDTVDVQRDHDFLDGDSIQSVIRRLNILNTCSVMKIDAQPCKKAPEESDDDDLCALSDRWEYQKTVRRWSRKLDSEPSSTGDLNLEPSSSHDSLLGEESGSHTDESPVLESKMPHSTITVEQAPDNMQIVGDVESSEPTMEGLIQPDSHVSSFPISPKLRRAASERLKSALKKMESFKKKSKKYPTNRNILEISDPVVSDQKGMQAKLEHLHCVDIGSPGVAPAHTPELPVPVHESTPVNKFTQGKGSPDSSYQSAASPISPVHTEEAGEELNSSVSFQDDSASLREYYSAHSQLLANFQSYGSTGRSLPNSGARKNSDSSLLEIFLLPQDHKPGSFPRLLKNGYIDTSLPFQPSAPAHSVPPSATPLGPGLRGATGAVSPDNSRFSVYDNLGPTSPLHSTGHRKPESRTDSQSSATRQSQVLRSLSQSSSEMDFMTDAASMVRSRSASAATSLEHQALSLDRSSDSLGVRGSVRKSSVAMEEFDAILQNLYKDISNLSRAIGEDEGDSQDFEVGVTSSSSVASREVSFDIGDQNGDLTGHSRSSSSGTGKEHLSTSLPVNKLDSDQIDPSTGGVDDSMDTEEGDRCSQTSSQDSVEEVEGCADDTLERIIMEARERRDSGVGSSLTRTSRERTRKKMRWESFQKCHRPSRASRELQIGGLSVCQLLPLRQLSLLKLTSIMEKCSPTNRSQWSWSVPRFMKRHKAPQFSDKNVFGVPFTVMLQRTGQPLPQCVLYAMRYLRKTSHDAIGIFRKSGVRSRIQKLRDMVESCPDSINFDDLQPYDVADLLKQYFRELPECLLTSKLSDTFRSIFSHVPVSQRLEALQTAVVLLPEENREVLHCLLLFLGDIAQHANKHQMNASNLAVCFAPSLFNFLGGHGTSSPRRQRKSPGVPEQRELLEQKAVHECFTFMITECKKLFMVPPSMYSRLHLSTLSNMEPVHLDEFYTQGKQPGPDYKAFGEEHIQILLKESHEKNRGWAPVSINIAGIEALQRKPQDGHPLRQWKCSVEIEAPPIEVLNRILHERHKWDDDMMSWNVVERLDRNSDVFHYVLNSMAPHPPRHFMVIRYWRPDLVKGACALVSRSVEHSGSQVASASDYDQGVRAVELGSYYLMEPCGSGRSRLTYISRTDLRGRCPEWYNRVFGHMCGNYLDRLRDSFRQDAEGPETKV